MRLIETSPVALAVMRGFSDSIADLHAMHESPLLRDGSAYDVDAYQRLHEQGLLHVVAVTADEGDELLAWGLLTVAKLPRRETPLCATDVMWSKTRVAGAALMRRLSGLADCYGAPLVITAAAGGALDDQLGRSQFATRTHHVYIYSRDKPDPH